ncbi:MAG: oligosaccharide repeat unit polymerase [Vibrionaceae bacterium]|nr:oligosaccharide repeat unit polymerase [Vibrionaceae bacterium]
MENLLLIAFCSFCAWFAFIMDGSRGKTYFYLSVPAIAFMCLTTVRFSIYYDQYVDFNQFELTEKTYAVVMWVFVSYSISFILFRSIVKNESVISLDTLRNKYSPRKIQISIYILTLLTLFALLINLSNVGFNLALMATNARQYELSFGKYWIVNYVYFLHVVVLVLIVIKGKLFGWSKINLLIMLVMVLESGLHGIKFTVFDALFFTFFSYVALSGGLSSKVKLYLGMMIMTFILFFSAFSFYIRGGGGSYDLFAFTKYLTPNYLNFFYYIEDSLFFLGYPFDGIIGFITLNVDLPRVLPEVDFHLNNKFNMLTGIPYMLSYFTMLGVMFFYFGTMLLTEYCKRNVSLAKVFVIAYVYFCYLMMFYSYYFGTKYKYIYFLLVFIVLDVLVRRNNNNADFNCDSSLQR